MSESKSAELEKIKRLVDEMVKQVGNESIEGSEQRPALTLEKSAPQLKNRNSK